MQKIQGVGYYPDGVRLVTKERALLDNELLIEVAACGICGTDVHIIEGEQGSVATKEGTILGHEYAGYVKEIGAKTKGFSVGDLVAIDPNIYCHECPQCKNHQYNFCENMLALGVNIDGGFTDYCFVPYQQAYKVNGEITAEEAAMMEPLACCLRGMDQLDLKAGQSALIIGAGTIGNMFAQLLKSSGLTVTVVDINANKLKRLHELGINDTYDVSTQKLPEQNYNIVIETAGASTTTMSLALEKATRGAQILMFSVPSGKAELDVRQIFEKELKIFGSFINPGTNQRALDMIEKGLIDVKKLVTDEYTTSEFQAGLTAAKNGESLKVLIK